MRWYRLVAAIFVIGLPGCAAWNGPRAPTPVTAPSAPNSSPPPANAAPSAEPVKSAHPPSTPGNPPVAPRVGPAANVPPVNPHKTVPAPAKTQPPPIDKPSPLDLAGLEQRLKDTHAIGVFTKLSLKNQVDDLLGQFRAFHQSTLKIPPDPLRRQYDALILKVLSLLQDSDPRLASDIASSREALWGILIDPQKFAKI